jgi:hypothetical protein
MLAVQFPLVLNQRQPEASAMSQSPPHNVHPRIGVAVALVAVGVVFHIAANWPFYDQVGWGWLASWAVESALVILLATWTALSAEPLPRRLAFLTAGIVGLQGLQIWNVYQDFPVSSWPGLPFDFVIVLGVNLLTELLTILSGWVAIVVARHRFALALRRDDSAERLSITPRFSLRQILLAIAILALLLGVERMLLVSRWEAVTVFYRAVLHNLLAISIAGLAALLAAWAAFQGNRFWVQATIATIIVMAIDLTVNVWNIAQQMDQATEYQAMGLIDEFWAINILSDSVVTSLLTMAAALAVLYQFREMGYRLVRAPHPNSASSDLAGLNSTD